MSSGLSGREGNTYVEKSGSSQPSSPARTNGRCQDYQDYHCHAQEAGSNATTKDIHGKNVGLGGDQVCEPLVEEMRDEMR